MARTWKSPKHNRKTIVAAFQDETVEASSEYILLGSELVHGS